MRIYLDTCCLMRPFDDQSFPRVRLEAMAVSDLLEYMRETDRIQWIAGRAVRLEVAACRFNDRREKVQEWLLDVAEWHAYSSTAAELASRLAANGIGDWDARHIATAETAGCDWFLTTDATLIKRSWKVLPKLSVRIANPLEFILENMP